MPRNGGTAQNGPFEEAEHHIIHGSDAPVDGVDRSGKASALPEGRDEKGLALEGHYAGGSSQGIKQGPNVGQGGRSSKN